MLRNKLIYIFILALLINNCASVSQKKRISSKAGPVPHYLKRAELNFQNGKEFLLNGDLAKANHYFDRVINILLDSGHEGVDKRQLDNYIAKISQLELAYLADNVSDDNIRRESFLDEVIATPLFTPSPREISQFKKKIKHKGKAKPKYSVPITINPRVISFIKAYQTVRHKNIQNALNRSTEYIDAFKKIFRDRGMPEDLAYLPIIESGFRVKALSRARAMGVWQFMAATAKMFGLRVDWIVDERRDPYKAAAAAADYLQHLYKQYGDWYLSLACYNGGPRRVNRAIRGMKTKDFFKIASTRRYLRRETRNYVPAFIASLIIAKSPEEYGFTIEPLEKIFEHTKEVQTPSPVSLKEMASLTNVPYTELKKINPELLRDFTPFNKKQYTVRLPLDADESTLTQLKRLPAEKKLFVGWYRVKRGDSLYAIARKFKTTVRKIKKTNKLRSNMIHPGRRLLIPRGF
ncbi:MAG: transglycosylase SLT domain-containing protein [bacterium]|nr:transglycosylase SLT domain-containing protein [bacterium]